MTDEEQNVDQEAMADDWAAAMAEQADAESGGEAAGGGDPAVQPAELDELQSEGLPVVQDEDVNLDLILDIPVTIAMEIGRTRISIRNLLQLNQGSVVELDRLAGEPMDVLVNGTLVAHGEVVVVNEKFGIRLTDVVSPSERVKKLK
ncbi:flagellar motor switch protein FliN [Thiohalobacter sp. IOR34]|uniref:flagellar motor switch protein FliN n=1 Tax=Thiohalobacter sp. IOR34 TaxID=3057176 RepID=UPI0025B0B4A2|nr:flagellar motor switch protein FliN [Thiohalobacter sp. IOR34]WJW74566.1 flagellar motor switch protein FliN [Thiohalobacter sp. IOR34]